MPRAHEGLDTEARGLVSALESYGPEVPQDTLDDFRITMKLPVEGRIGLATYLDRGRKQALGFLCLSCDAIMLRDKQRPMARCPRCAGVVTDEEAVDVLVDHARRVLSVPLPGGYKIWENLPTLYWMFARLWRDLLKKTSG